MELLSKYLLEQEIVKLKSKYGQHESLLILVMKREYEFLDKIEKECIKPINTYGNLEKRMKDKHVYFFSDEQIRYFTDAVNFCKEIKEICERGCL